MKLDNDDNEYVNSSRYALSARAPSLRSIHHVIPLNIRYLKLDNTSFTINNLTHSFHTFMEPADGAELPIDMRLVNLEGGRPYDIDRYGNRDLVQNMAADDVRIERENGDGHDAIQNHFELLAQLVNHDQQVDLQYPILNDVLLGGHRNRAEPIRVIDQAAAPEEIPFPELGPVNRSPSPPRRPNRWQRPQPPARFRERPRGVGRPAPQNFQRAQVGHLRALEAIRQAQYNHLLVRQDVQEARRAQQQVQRVEEVDGLQRLPEENQFNQLADQQAQLEFYRTLEQQQHQEYENIRENLRRDQLGLPLAPEAPLPEVRSFVQYSLVSIGKLSRFVAPFIRHYVRFPEGISIRDALRQHLGNMLLGKRITLIGCLEIDIASGVLRIPEGLKFRIQQISLRQNTNKVMDAIRPVIHESSLPLKGITVKIRNFRDAFFQNKVLRDTESLLIKMSPGVRRNWERTIVSVPTNRIHMTRCSLQLAELVFVVRDWLDKLKDIGTRISIQTRNVEMLLEGIRNQLQGICGVLDSRRCIKFPKCVTIPIGAYRELNIYGYKSPSHREELNKILGEPWMIVMEMMERGSAVPV
ncbi:hypothetical protein CRE_17910 [Caenorhabditis remanei]|uniref:Uncharacterized protein n=1 Tax=Caenorhabditis remanei TaxID=31234 RepID=E3MDH6_CAERE|nr:hypothetical protein CRE_17910 [Caenorhabditis remanei]